MDQAAGVVAPVAEAVVVVKANKSNQSDAQKKARASV